MPIKTLLPANCGRNDGNNNTGGRFHMEEEREREEKASIDKTPAACFCVRVSVHVQI